MKKGKERAFDQKISDQKGLDAQKPSSLKSEQGNKPQETAAEYERAAGAQSGEKESFARRPPVQLEKAGDRRHQQVTS